MLRLASNCNCEARILNEYERVLEYNGVVMKMK
jgi:hypothetical protein